MHNLQFDICAFSAGPCSGMVFYSRVTTLPENAAGQYLTPASIRESMVAATQAGLLTCTFFTAFPLLPEQWLPVKNNRVLTVAGQFMNCT